MPGLITRSEKSITYTITHPDWVCEWILFFDNKVQIKKSCSLNGILDPTDWTRGDYVLKLIPGLFEEVGRVIRKWIEDGESNAKLLLLPDNKPEFIFYAEAAMGLKIIT